MAAIPEDIEAKLKVYLAAIAKLFVAPRITLIVRAPEGGNVKGDLILGNDEPSAVEAVFKAMVIDEATLFAKSPEQSRLIVKQRGRHAVEDPHLRPGGPAASYHPRRGR